MTTNRRMVGCSLMFCTIMIMAAFPHAPASRINKDRKEQDILNNNDQETATQSADALVQAASDVSGSFPFDGVIAQLFGGGGDEDASTQEAVNRLQGKGMEDRIQKLEHGQVMSQLQSIRQVDLKRLAGKGLATKITDSLAADNSDSMPAEIRHAGEEAVDGLKASVLSAFTAGGEESIKEVAGTQQGPAFTELVELLGLSELMPKFDTPDSTILAYVSETIEQVKKNPILLEFARQFSSLPDDMRKKVFPTGAKANGEIRKAVVYSYLLNSIGKTLMYEPMKQPGGKELLYEQMANTFDKMSEARKDEWEPFFNLFEKMKLASANKPFLMDKMKTFSAPADKKDKAGLYAGEGIKKALGPTGGALAGNILEAMYQDVNQGNEANAQAGFELMVEPNSQDDRHDMQFVKDGTPLGVRRWRMPLPRAWANLYSSWNGAFVSAYQDSPMYLAKLINPVTLGTYHTDEEGAEDLYLWTRGIQLYTHLHAMKMTRANDQSRDPGMDWRSDTLTQLWGFVNKDAANAYHQRVAKEVIPTTEKERNHHAGLRKRAEEVFAGVKAATKAAKRF